MLFAKIDHDDTVLEWPVTEKQLRERMSLPEEITDATLDGTGYVIIPSLTSTDVPQQTSTHRLSMSQTLVKDTNGKWARQYVLEQVPQVEAARRRAQKLKEVRVKRDMLMRAFDWRISRYNREVALNLTPKDDIIVLHTYMQDLADITTADDPYLAVFPSVPE